MVAPLSYINLKRDFFFIFFKVFPLFVLTLAIFCEPHTVRSLTICSGGIVFNPELVASGRRVVLHDKQPCAMCIRPRCTQLLAPVILAQGARGSTASVVWSRWSRTQYIFSTGLGFRFFSEAFISTSRCPPHLPFFLPMSSPARQHISSDEINRSCGRDALFVGLQAAQCPIKILHVPKYVFAAWRFAVQVEILQQFVRW